MSTDAMEDEPTEGIALLIRRCAYRDALQMTAERLGLELGRFCMALLADQQEAVQALEELLEDFYRAMPSLDNRPLRPFLYERALTVCRQRLSQRSEAQSARALSLTPPDTRRLPPEAAAAQRDARLVRSGLAGLKGPEREAALLRYAAGLDYETISALMGCDPATTKKRVGKALLGLRQGELEGASG